MAEDEKEIVTLHPSTGRWLVGSFAGWLVLLSCVILIGIPILLLIWLNRRFTVYRITDQRIILEHGVLFRKIDEIELYRVKDVRLDFSLLNQMVNIGTISLNSSDASTNGNPMTMPHIWDARKHRETLRTLVEAIRQRRGVKELDMQGGSDVGV